MAPGSPSPGRDGHGGEIRRDIQGIRALAILAVVGYHAGVPHMGGGYVGVDVFFVVSGFLITGLLFDELSVRGRLSFAAFYARRARRLLPSAVLVVVATLAVSMAVLSPLRAATVLRDGLASGLYVANYRFALQATSYLSVGSAPSPFLHFWSLGVEEQFYLIWPAVLVLSALMWRRRRSSRLAAFWVLAGIFAASWIASLWLTRTNEPWAFFSLPTRAWELAIGGLLALSVPVLRRMPAAASAALGWAGLGAVVWAVVGLSASVPFPGTAALLPVGGAAALVAAGCRQPRLPRHASRPPRRLNASGLLSLAPLQAGGRVSYTWYLWHWPFVILAPFVIGHTLSLNGRLVAVAASLGAAVLTTVLVEDPIRRSPWLGRPLGGLTLVGSSGVAVATAAVVAFTAVPAVLGSGQAAKASLQAPVAAQASSGLVDLQQTADAVTEEVQLLVAQSSVATRVPGNLQPSLWHAYADEGSPFYDGCFDSFTATAVHQCVYGDPAGTHTMVLFGDSHALMWFPALQAVALSQGWRLVVAAKATCPPIEIPVYSPDLHEWYSQCTQWREAEVERIAAMGADLVVLGFSREYGVNNDRVLVDGPAWLEGLSQMIGDVGVSGARVVVLGDVPYPPTNIPECLSAHLTNATRCLVTDAPPSVDPARIEAEATVVTGAGAAYVDTRPWFCSAGVCDAMVDNLLVYRDDNHITATYAKWLTPVMQAQLALATQGLLSPTGQSGPNVAVGRR